MTPIDPYRFVFDCLFGRAQEGVFSQARRRLGAAWQRITLRLDG